MTRVRLFLLLGVAMPMLSLALSAQTERKKPHGGTFVLNGETLTIPGKEISRHIEFLRKINPGSSHAVILNLAWARAIRIAGAKQQKLEIDPDKFSRWMITRHSQFRSIWSKNNRVDPSRVQEHLLKMGFESIQEYEDHCREEHLAEQFLAIDHPEISIGEDEVQKHFDLVHTKLAVKFMAWAPETLELAPLDRNNPEHLAEYRRWWAAVPTSRKKTFDDLDRPALESTAMYFRFKDKTVEELRDLFEAKRDSLGNKSFADVTAFDEMDKVARQKLWNRWTRFRKGQYLHLDSTLPRQTSDWDAFLMVEEHLVREWKLVRFLGRIWRELQDAPTPIDVESTAHKYAIPFLRRSFRPMRELVNDPVLPGDHPFRLRKTEPGSLFDYGTSAAPGTIWISEGVVDQPGLHASIWSLVRAEEQRVLSADEIILRAWPEFESSWRFVSSGNRRDRLLQEIEKAAGAYALGKGVPLEKIAIEARAHALESAAKLVGGAKFLGPFYVTPHLPSKQSARAGGQLGKRVLNMLQLEWVKVNPLAREYRVGEILPIMASPQRKIWGMARIEKIFPPGPALWKMDSMARKTVRDDLIRHHANERTARIRRVYAWPNIVREFQLKAPGLDEIMSRTVREQKK